MKSFLKQLQTIRGNFGKHNIDPFEAINIEIKFIENMLVEMAKREANYYTFFSVIYPMSVKQHFEKMGLTVMVEGQNSEKLTFVW